MLLDNGANVFVKDDSGITPLHLATTIGYIEVTKMHLDNGAEVNATTRYMPLDNGAQEKLTPPHNAVSNGRTLGIIMAPIRYCYYLSQQLDIIVQTLDINIVGDGTSPDFIKVCLRLPEFIISQLSDLRQSQDFLLNTIEIDYDNGGNSWWGDRDISLESGFGIQEHPRHYTQWEYANALPACQSPTMMI
ncbi:hypothetical protein BC936DRAFT_146900 [Jimgerdemannia flammicorona]|uniref:Uncharacterized protein n=1 Tax=Jimgerdemannia flammicorona TaxID=994334 RepID=A0A433D6I7_9FUNG|nr:hypothetical protein BC936DRAFT_146900 [Jimgerdemannia flammicorona]